MFTAESEQAMVRETKELQQSSFDDARYAERAMLDEAAADEKKKVQAAMDLLRLAEEKLEQEAQRRPRLWKTTASRGF